MGHPRGFTLIEMVAVLAVMSVLAVITAPVVAALEGRAAVSAGAQRLALALRSAQAQAAVSSERVGVSLSDQGHTWEILTETDAGWTCVARASSSASCSSNYPDDCVLFGSSGFPQSADGHARAGTFTVRWGAEARSVVVQLGGRVRCP